MQISVSPSSSSPADQLAAARDWFSATGREAFQYQSEAWAAYLDGESGLINAPTGSGKSLAAWLGPVLQARHEQMTSLGVEPSAAGLRVLWITPLRALANDLVGNLRAPLKALGVPWNVEVRTGDTSSSVRKRQRERPPQALVITPESVSVLLS